MNGNKNKYVIKNYYYFQNIKEYEQFIYEEKIENMYIDIKSNKIPLTEILNEIKDFNEIIEENSHNALVIEFKQYNNKIYITSIDEIKFSFIFDSKICKDILRKALKVEKTENDFIEIINRKQFYYLSKIYQNYFFYCQICNSFSSIINFHFFFCIKMKIIYIVYFYKKLNLIF